jgi:uncharacterized membrane protein YgcG
MKSPDWTFFVRVFLAGAVLAFSGCATVARYRNVPQADSATVTGSEPKTSPGSAQNLAMVMLIDGAIVDLKWYSTPTLVTYVTPGEHELMLVLKRSSQVQPAVPIVEVNLLANHHYQFLTDDGFNARLLDLADGSDQPVVVKYWAAYGTLPNETDDAGDVPVETVDFGGAEHVRPPYHPSGPDGDDHHPPGAGGNPHGPPSGHTDGNNHGGNDHGGQPPRSGGSGGPPSIPHDPRPSPSGGGGGGRNGGGSGGGSGGSSGHSGGGSSGGGGGSSHSSGGSGKKG